MTLLALLALTVLAVGTLLARTIHADGRGHRPPPRSHVGEETPTWRAAPRAGARR